jgi:hypothetical protein
MKRVFFAMIAAFGCGGQTSQFRLSVPSAEFADGQPPTIEMETEQTHVVQFVLVGGVPPNVVFSGINLPSFATMAGSLVTLAPGRGDAGTFVVTVSASDGKHSDVASLRVVVNRGNTAPRWQASGGSYFFGDDLGLHFAAYCPGPHCTAVGTAKVQALVCDDDDDGVTVEVEVVPAGTPFSGRATHSAFASRGTTRYCTQQFVTVPLTGLSPEQSYVFAVRIFDEFGALANPGNDQVDGWFHSTGYRFDQGPCATRQCACIPAGGGCERADQCCSGTADPGGWAMFSYTCK